MASYPYPRRYGYIGGTRSGIYSFEGCFWDIQKSGQTSNFYKGIIGKTTAEMMTRSTFTDAGWDFVGEQANGSNGMTELTIVGKRPDGPYVYGKDKVLIMKTPKPDKENNGKADK